MAGLWAQLALVAAGAGVAADKLQAGFVDLAAIAPDVVVDMRYAGADNFLGRPARGYGAARCLLTKEAARAPGPATDPRHNPAVPRTELFQRGYIAARSGHSRGSTVDLTLTPAAPLRPPPPPEDCRSLYGQNSPDGSLNMGTTFDCFDERAHPASDGVSADARRNRLLLKLAMEKHGFVAYAQEWWHFTLAKEPFPNTAFDFEIQRAP